MSRQSGGVAAAACMSVVLAAGMPAQADSAADFYRNKEIKVIIGSSVGGGYDQYARVLYRHMGKHIPGNPRMIGQHMGGSGSLRATNYIYNVAPKDGSVIGAVQHGIAFEPLFDGKGVQFDAGKLNWIGSSNKDILVVVSWHTTPFKTVEDMRRQEMIIGSSAATGGDASYAAVLNDVLGTRIKSIPGYRGEQLSLAIEGGELHGRTALGWSAIKVNHRPWLEGKKINLILQLGLEKHPELPDVPLVMNVARSDEDRQVLEIVLGSLMMGRPYVAPPNVPEDRVRALRAAFDATVTDKEFLADAGKQNLEISPLSGVEIHRLIDRIYAAPRPLVERAKKMLRER